jgi:hypothetical protein
MTCSFLLRGYPGNKIKEKEMGGTCSLYCRNDEQIQNKSQKTFKEEQFGGPRNLWEVNIKMDVKYTGCERMD